MRITYNNWIDDAGLLTASLEDTGYPISNVQDQRLSYPYKATASAVTILINLSNDSGYFQKLINTLAILGHNLSSSATVTFDFNDVNSWSGKHSETLTWNEGIILKYSSDIANLDEGCLLTEAGDFLITEAGDYLYVLASKYQWVQIQITDTLNPDGYIQLGRIWIGDYLTIIPSSLLNFKVTKKRSDIVIYGKDRQKFGVEGVGWRRIELSFPETDSTMIDSLFTMYKKIGNHQSVIFCNFDTDRNYTIVEPMYCSIDGEIGFKHIDRMRFSYNLNLEEDK